MKAAKRRGIPAPIERMARAFGSEVFRLKEYEPMCSAVGRLGLKLGSVGGEKGTGVFFWLTAGGGSRQHGTMPRRARSIEGGLVYHILDRSNARMTLFEKDEDYAALDRVLEEAHEREPLRVLACCVLPNHGHRVV